MEKITRYINHPIMKNFIVFYNESYEEEGKTGMEHKECRNIRKDRKNKENRGIPIADSGTIHHSKAKAGHQGQNETLSLFCQDKSEF